jgi:hypothetical protein
VSAAHSLANVRKTPAEMIEAFAAMHEVIDGVSKTGARRVELIAGLSTVFGCTLQGAVPYADIAAIAGTAVQAGADVIALGDTTGEATPRQVGEIIELVRDVAGDRLRSLHLHDTRGLGLANTLIALQHGIREFDASLAGLGGCPHAPGATGNVNTEDLVFMLDSMGYDTGIDLTSLIASRDVLADALRANRCTVIWREPVCRSSLLPLLDVLNLLNHGCCNDSSFLCVCLFCFFCTCFSGGTTGRVAACRHPRGRVVAYGDGADLRDDSWRPRRRSHQGRAAARRRYAPFARHRCGFFSHLQSQQEERRTRSR